MGRFTALVNVPFSGKGAVIADKTLVMPGVTQATDLGLAIPVPVTNAGANTLGRLLGASVVAQDSVQAGTTWTYREVELLDANLLEKFEYSQASADILAVTSVSGVTVTITSLESNADCCWLYAVSGTGAGLLAFCTAMNGGTATTKTATGWDSTTKVVKIFRFGHPLVNLAASGSTLKTQAAVGAYTAFVWESYLESVQSGISPALLNPTIHDNLVLPKARFYSRLSIRSNAGR